MANGPGRPGPEVFRQRRRVAGAVGVTVVLLGYVLVRAATAGGDPGPSRAAGSGHGASPSTRAAAASSRPATPSASPTRSRPTPVAPPLPGALAPGSNPAVLPGPLLIADKANSRLLEVSPQGRVIWQFPRPGDLRPGQSFVIPDDAFFTPNGRDIVATEEDDFVVSVIDVATHRIVYRYGTPGVPGSAPGHLDNPDDAVMLGDGSLLMADIKNCRVILIPPNGRAVSHQLGSTGTCYHNPPQTFGSPNGVFPLKDGHFLVTEINGDWVDEMTLSGQVLWSTHPPGVAYPSDTNQVGPDRYLTVDYSSPGQIVEFNRAGQVLWRYAPTGANALNHPSLALPLPNGDVVCNDDWNNRVIVVDPRTDRIVWQYGHRGVPGTARGYLHIPDGLDLAPPFSLAGTHLAAIDAAHP